MGEVKQAIEALQASRLAGYSESSTPPVVYRRPETVRPFFYGSLVDHNECHLTRESEVDRSSPLVPERSSLLVDQSNLLESMPEVQVELGETLEVVAVTISEPLVKHGNLRVGQINDSSLLVVHNESLAVEAIAVPVDVSASEAEEAAVNDNEPQALTAGSPLVVESEPLAVEKAIAVPVVTEPVEEAIAVVGSETAEQVTQKTPSPLTLGELGERLGRDKSGVFRAKNKGNPYFRKWSKKLDPDGIAWEYREGGVRSVHYYPLV